MVWPAYSPDLGVNRERKQSPAGYGASDSEALLASLNARQAPTSLRLIASASEQRRANSGSAPLAAPHASSASWSMSASAARSEAAAGWATAPNTGATAIAPNSARRFALF